MKILTIRISGNEVRQVIDNNGLTQDLRNEVLLSWDKCFNLVKEDSEKGIKGLRNPQIGAFHSILSHWTYSDEIGTVVLPTGTGKTETMLSLLVSEEIPQLVVIVPTDPLRNQISDKFLKLGLLGELNIIPNTIKLPVVGTIKSSFDNVDNLKLFLGRCNVIVATASILSKMHPEMLNELHSSCTHIFIDEAHHSEASSWNKFRKRFEDKKVIQFTATPFRNDNKKLDGKIIFNYPLRKAQAEGYFKPITFKKIYEYSAPKKDNALAKKGIEQLRLDKQNYQHILLARVSTKKRADEVFEIYKQYQEFRVLKIHSGLGVRERKEIYNKIISKEVDIIVCVDMLGEGFDLPNLKIAVFHDIRQSLPITLQFVGRFTRTKYDEELGNATIIANLADLDVNNELDELYARDPDWNLLLPILSENRTQKEIDMYTFIQGFKDNENFPITVQSIKPALSTVVFRNHTNFWFPTNYTKGISDIETYELIRHNLNSEDNILVILTAKKLQADWINNENILDLYWNYYVVYWETQKSLLFIHSSDNSSLHIELAKSIIGDNAEIINGDNGGKIFRVLSGIHRFKLQNLGLTEIIGKLIRFVMRVGSDIEPALSSAIINKAKKAMIFGAGYENGEDVSIGCSYKGRIWSRRKNDIPTLVKWFKYIGKKITDEKIDADEVLKGALVSKAISERPQVYPFYVDWNEEVYKQTETRYVFNIDNLEYELYRTNLVLVNPSDTGNIIIGLEVEDHILIELMLIIYPDENGNATFKFEKVNSAQIASVTFGNKNLPIEDYFYNETPSIWFVNGDYLVGNSYIEIKNIVPPYNSSEILSWDWNGIDLSMESQKYNPKLSNSIQFRVIETLKRADYDIIFDDDGSGEIADVVTLKIQEDKIIVELYHLKYAIGGKVSRQIKNLYEVCGQAQKSVNWKFKRSKEFLEHLLRREALRENNILDSRIERGTKEDLIQIIDLVNNRIPLEFEIYIIQPGISRSDVSEQQLTLLGVTENYLVERAMIKLNVIGNA